MYTGQNIVRLAYGDRLIRPKSPKVKTLPIAYNITEAHTDFPIYIKPSSITGFGSLTLAEAQSLRFYADAGKTTELPREVVSADEIYVKASLATGTGNKLYLDWDGVSPDYAVSDTYGARNVWNSNYKAVYHFEGNANDSTSNGNNGTASNVLYGDGYATFNGSNSQVVLPNNIINNRNLVTVSTIATVQGQGITIDGKIFDARNGPNRNRMIIMYNYGTGHLSLYCDFGSSVEPKYIASYGTKYYIAGVVSGGTAYLYINGVLQGSGSVGTTTRTSTNARIGNEWDAAVDRFLNGNIFDTSIFYGVKSPSRISTEYANQSNPATFFGTLT